MKQRLLVTPHDENVSCSPEKCSFSCPFEGFLEPETNKVFCILQEQKQKKKMEKFEENKYNFV